MKIVFKKWYLERKAVFPFTAEIFVFLEAEIIEIFVKKRKPAGNRASKKEMLTGMKIGISLKMKVCHK
ncbi:unnamed protein product [Prunus armeniaca]